MNHKYNGYRNRKQKKFENRVNKRRHRKEVLQARHSFNEMYSIDNWVTALKKSRKGTSWKSSVQYYSFRPIRNTMQAMDKLQQGKFPYPVNTNRVIIYERGKRREVEPIKISKRHGEHVFCDCIYSPLLFPSLIYDNGASQTGKGVEFTRKRFEKHLKDAVKNYGNNFYIWKFDFKSFFESINYKVCRELFTELFKDKESVDFAMESLVEHFVGNIQNEKDPEKRRQMTEIFKSEDAHGVCLGSQISQITALMIPNKMDHYIKDKMRMKYFDRFMDDGIVISDKKEILERLYEGCKEIAGKLRLTFNQKKTSIIKASKGITFLKIKYNLVQKPDGSYGILKRISRATVTRMRRKLHRFKNLLDNGEINIEAIRASFMSWYGHARKVARTYQTRKRMLKLYISLFGYYGLSSLGSKYAKLDQLAA